MRTQPGAELLQALQARGWMIAHSDSAEPLLPPDLQQRYPRLPAELTAFLETIDSCANAEETVWFLCREDYRLRDAERFRWNEFELMILEDADADAQERVRRFWDRHFPFLLCVHSDYDYLALSLDEKSFGAIVHGCGPVFEETTQVASSFTEFLTLFRKYATGDRDDYPLSYFV